jgi:pilus assembly protein Flp/PilA
MSKINKWMVEKVAQRTHSDEEAQGLAEYGLILALVAVVAIGALQLLGTGITDVLGQITDAF